MKINWNMRNQIMIPSMALLILAGIIETFVSYQSSRTLLVHTVEQGIRQTSVSLQSTINEFLEERKADIQILAKEPAILQLLTHPAGSQATLVANPVLQMNARLEIQIQNKPYYETMGLLNADGIVVVSNDKKVIGINLKERTYFQEAMSKGQLVISNALLSKSTGNPIFVVAVPVQISGKTSGVFFASINLSHISDQFISPIKIGQEGYVYMVDANGIIIAYPDKTQLFKLNITDWEFGKNIIQSTHDDLMEYVFKGVSKYAAYSRIPASRWSVVATAPVSDTLSALVTLRNQLIGVVFLMMLILGIVMYSVSQRIANPLMNATQVADEVVNKVTDTTQKIYTISSDLSNAANEHATAIASTSSAVTQVDAMVSKNLENALQSAEVAQKSQNSANRGRLVVQEMIGAINEINSANGQIMEQIQSSNQEIAQIVTVINEIGNKTKIINDIVFQTKLLSFNASVEAARAGEHGKGFSVVAEEVGNLAQMSGSAAKEISALLNGSIRKVETIVDNTQNRVQQLVQMGRDKVNDGTRIAGNCGTVLTEIVESVSEVSRMIGEISSASKEQAIGVSEITQSMAKLEKVAHDNTTSAHLSASAAEELSNQTGTLHTVVNALSLAVTGKTTQESEIIHTAASAPSSENALSFQSTHPSRKVA